MNPRCKRLLSMFLALAMVFSMITPVTASATSVTTTPKNTIEIEVGETAKLTVSNWYQKTTWKSSDKAIATVSNSGTVTGIAPGTATITATTKSQFGFWGSSKTTKYTVIVTESVEKDILTVKAGEDLQLHVDARGAKVSWSSSNKNIATVSKFGLVSGVSEGNVTIIATVKKVTGSSFFWWMGSKKTTVTTTEFEVTVLPNDELPTNPPESIPATPIIPVLPSFPTCPTEPTETEPAVATYTVTFETNGGSAVDPQTVEEGMTAVEPNAPSKENCNFIGWYSDPELASNYDFATPVTSDITVYAAWEDVYSVDNDNDALSDGIEIFLGTDVNKSDTDEDGLSDDIEVIIGTNPTLIDSDYDGINDGDDDEDGDGLSNLEELSLGTSLVEDDSDHDGLTDYQELYTYRTQALVKDTDSDGAIDGWEVEHGYDPLTADNVFNVSSGSSDESVSVQVDLQLPGDQISTLNVQKVNDNLLIDNSVPGYIGPAFDFSLNGTFSEATISFTFDSSLLDDSAFNPVIFYYNEETQIFEELPTTVNGNVASTTVNHFSSYILLNKTEFDAVWDNEIKAPGNENSIAKDLKIAFVIDVSGSMSGSNISTVKTVMNTFINNMGENDQAAIVKFASSASVAQSLTKDKEQLSAVVNGLSASGGTDISEGVALGIEQLAPSATYSAAATVLNSSPEEPDDDFTEESEESIGEATTDENEVIAKDEPTEQAGLAEETNETTETSIVTESSQSEETEVIIEENVEGLEEIASIEATVTSTDISMEETIPSSASAVPDESGAEQPVGEVANSYDVIILLTDGEDSDFNNYWSQYAQLCVEYEIIAYSIGIGSSVSSSHLTNFAEATGGKYYHASVADQLNDYFEDIKGETVDYTTDSNNDGISDYFTAKLCDGSLRIGTGKQNPFFAAGIDFDSIQADTDGDYDNDGLLNGQELIVKHNEALDRVYVWMMSDPTAADSDYDGIDDNEEESQSAAHNNSFEANVYHISGGHTYHFDADFVVDYSLFFGDNTKFNQDLAVLASLYALDMYEEKSIGDDESYGYLELKKGTSGSTKGRNGTAFGEIFGLSDCVNIDESQIATTYATKDSNGNYVDQDDVAEVFFGHRPVSYNGEQREIIFLIVRGTNGTQAEWSSNFDIGYADASYYDKTGEHPDWTNTINHKGFDVAATRILRAYNQYIDNLISSGKMDASTKRSIFITGHSRGAAIANILGAHFEDHSAYDSFVYTMASPYTTTNTAANNYQTIFNIRNSDDLVTYLPLKEWGFYKFGKTLNASVEKDGYEDKKAFTNADGTFEKLFGSDYNSNSYVDDCEKDFYAMSKGRSDFYVLDYTSGDGQILEGALHTFDSAFTDFEKLLKAAKMDKYCQYNRNEKLVGYTIDVTYCPAYAAQNIADLAAGKEIEVNYGYDTFDMLGIDLKGVYSTARRTFALASGKIQLWGMGPGGMEHPHIPGSYYLIARNTTYNEYKK